MIRTSNKPFMTVIFITLFVLVMLLRVAGYFFSLPFYLELILLAVIFLFLYALAVWKKEVSPYAPDDLVTGITFYQEEKEDGGAAVKGDGSTGIVTDQDSGQETPRAPDSGETSISAGAEAIPSTAGESGEPIITKETAQRVIEQYHTEQEEKTRPFLKTFTDNALSIKENLNKSQGLSQTINQSSDRAFILAQGLENEIGAISRDLESSIKHSGNLHEQSREIQDILGIMSDISSKIHVLSINASIVSARAGIHGREFAVVAQEIRRLAKETEEALKGIEHLVQNIERTVNAITGISSNATKTVISEKEVVTMIFSTLNQLKETASNAIKLSTSVQSHITLQGKAMNQIFSLWEENHPLNTLAGVHHQPVQTELPPPAPDSTEE